MVEMHDKIESNFSIDIQHLLREGYPADEQSTDYYDYDMFGKIEEHFNDATEFMPEDIDSYRFEQQDLINLLLNTDQKFVIIDDPIQAGIY